MAKNDKSNNRGADSSEIAEQQVEQVTPTDSAEPLAPETDAPPVDDAPPAPELEVLETTEDVNLRKEPSMRADIIEVLKAGTKVEVLDKQETWCEVVGGGYIKARYLR